MSSELVDIIKRIEQLETDSHPPKDLCEFGSWQELDDRIKRIEEALNAINNK